MSHTIERLRITVEGVTHAIGPLEVVEDLKREITRTVREGGGFVDFSVDGGERLSILVTSTTMVTISAKTVSVDSDVLDGRNRSSWRPGDIDPYGGGSIDFI